MKQLYRIGCHKLWPRPTARTFPGEVLVVQSLLQCVWARDPRAVAISKRRPVVGFPSDQEASGRLLLTVSSDLVVLLVLEARSRLLRNEGGQAGKAEHKSAVIGTCKRHVRGHRQQARQCRHDPYPETLLHRSTPGSPVVAHLAVPDYDTALAGGKIATALACMHHCPVAGRGQRLKSRLALPSPPSRAPGSIPDELNTLPARFDGAFDRA